MDQVPSTCAKTGLVVIAVFTFRGHPDTFSPLPSITCNSRSSVAAITSGIPFRRTSVTTIGAVICRFSSIGNLGRSAPLLFHAKILVPAPIIITGWLLPYQSYKTGLPTGMLPLVVVCRTIVPSPATAKIFPSSVA